jgi:siroheme synthase
MRGLSQAVTFVTATAPTARASTGTRWRSPQHTVVFYMSAAQIDHIAAQPAAHGMSASQPVALLGATWPDERVLNRHWVSCWRCASARGCVRLTLLIVGEVAALAQVRGLVAAEGPGGERAQEQGS